MPRRARDRSPPRTASPSSPTSRRTTRAAADIVFVCAGGNPATFDDRATFAWLRRLARQGVIIGGISGGPYVLARAGLLDGRRATLHWEHAAAFHEAFPDVDVVPSLFVLDGDRITCSGGVSALDMMVALIARDHGHDLAAAVGEWFLLTHIREGMGPQRMDLRHRLGVSDEGLLAVLRAMEANLESPKPREDLARLAGVSLRQLERLFRDRLGRSIHAHYLALRLDRARQLLRETSLPGPRRGDRHRLRLRQPVQPRLRPRLWRAAEPVSETGDVGRISPEGVIRRMAAAANGGLRFANPP